MKLVKCFIGVVILSVLSFSVMAQSRTSFYLEFDYGHTGFYEREIPRYYVPSYREMEIGVCFRTGYTFYLDFCHYQVRYQHHHPRWRRGHSYRYWNDDVALPPGCDRYHRGRLLPEGLYYCR